MEERNSVVLIICKCVVYYFYFVSNVHDDKICEGLNMKKEGKQSSLPLIYAKDVV